MPCSNVKRWLDKERKNKMRHSSFNICSSSCQEIDSVCHSDPCAINYSWNVHLCLIFVYSSMRVIHSQHCFYLLIYSFISWCDMPYIRTYTASLNSHDRSIALYSSPHYAAYNSEVQGSVGSCAGKRKPLRGGHVWDRTVDPSSSSSSM